MWQHFKQFRLLKHFAILQINFNSFIKISFFVLCLLGNKATFSQSDTSSISPVFIDSILKNKIDTTKWTHLHSTLNIHRDAKEMNIQKQKAPTTSVLFLFIAACILFLLLLLRLLFEDFSFSLIDGIFSTKKYLIYYKSKKYDSLIALLMIYLIKIAIFSFIIFVGIDIYRNYNFTVFDTYSFVTLLLAVGVFSIVKNTIEFIFNWVIDTQEEFRTFFLQNLFSELLLSITLMILVLLYIYCNQNFHSVVGLLALSVTIIFGFFNIIRSYQLMSNIHISYKLHFFLYICAFKILPILLMTKYIVKNIA